jgi:hypothetical protein
MKLLWLVSIWALCISGVAFAQQTNVLSGTVFNEVEIRVDTAMYAYSKNRISVGGEQYLPFHFTRNDQTIEVRLYLRNNVQAGIRSIGLPRSDDYTVLDSLTLINAEYYRTRIRFNDLSNTEFPAFQVDVQVQDVRRLFLPLLPFTATYATIYPGEGDLYIGEEKRFEIISNNIENLKIDQRWKKKEHYEYRFVRKDEKVFLAILPLVSGQIEVDFTPVFKKPSFGENELVYKDETQVFNLFVRGSRLSFLRFDLREVVWERDQREGIEVQIDHHRLLQLNKTYRIENTDERGGPLIAELHTIRRLSNDKVLCSFRPYHYHDQSEGYLYIKDGDEPFFITNMTIIPEPRIDRVSILRSGGSWVESKELYPGESVEIRLEGKSLSRAALFFEDLEEIKTDSLLRNDKVAHYRLRVPLGIRKKSINIYNGKSNTGITFNIREHQRPRDFDFVVVEYGGAPKRVNEVNQPLLHRGTIGNVNIRFDGYLIDEPDILYGKQYLEIEVRIIDERNTLREKQIIDNIEICPGDGSPRFFAYSSSNGCMNEAISLNDYLTNKTHALSNWSKIEIIVRHRKSFYNGLGYSERIEIIKEKLVTFDVDLSIPAGLLIKKVGVDGFPGLSGISLSMLAQFSFYQKGEIQRLRPYKIGAGFLAQNAFNFNPEADRDLGIVILGSVYPSRKERKLTFPLYAGFGYFLNEGRFFYLVGPGIRVNF